VGGGRGEEKKTNFRTQKTPKKTVLKSTKNSGENITTVLWQGEEENQQIKERLAEQKGKRASTHIGPSLKEKKTQDIAS